MRCGTVVLAVLLVAAACSDGREKAAAPSPSSTTSTTVAAAPTTTTARAAACPATGVPASASDVATAPGDLDGDHEADELTSYRAADGAWHVQVRLAAGGGADLLLPAAGDASVQVLGGADLDGDGRDEAWARTGAGASAAIVGLVRLTDCSLSRITFASGDPAEFAVGGTVGTAAGLECRAGTAGSVLTSYTATNTGDGSYEVVAQEWALDGTSLVPGASRTTTVAANDDTLARASSFSCGGLAL